jgi:hypothetical protein
MELQMLFAADGESGAHDRQAVAGPFLVQTQQCAAQVGTAGYSVDDNVIHDELTPLVSLCLP